MVLLLLASGAVAAALLIHARDRTAGGSNLRYVCPMHLQVTSVEPGECPICRMALESIGRESTAGGAASLAALGAVENVRRHNVVDFVRKRALLFDARELRGPASVEGDGSITAVFYNDQIDALAADEEGTFSPTQQPGVTVPVRRAADPAIAWDGSTSRIRFQRVAGGAGKTAAPLPSGQVGWLELARKPREVLAVPASAVLQSPEGPYVLALVEGFRFERRRIEIGETFVGLGIVAVLSGLHEQDRVVSRATFFLDAERRLGGQTGWETSPESAAP